MPREFDLADSSSLSLNVSGNVVIYFENRSKTREPFGECENLFNLNSLFLLIRYDIGRKQYCGIDNERDLCICIYEQRSNMDWGISLETDETMGPCILSSLRKRKQQPRQQQQQQQ